MLAETKPLACELPATTGVPLSHYSCADLALELVKRGVVAAISAATIWRILTGDALRPWFHRSWIAPEIPSLLSRRRWCLICTPGSLKDVRWSMTSL